ncbi:MAG TPA: hypothetical protein DDZ80_24200 [Cyanobacteria bacterium UBA8803]|nr:hypothetical protein [Cyanobacteria bacterium UBA9273]HBL61415.1 hypothetical protein [Cyanobacteria bacterium UBA8803]
MNNWTGEELAFRCERLSVRLEKLAENFLQIAILSVDVSNSEAVLAIVRESKRFLELIASDLDVDRAFELAQMQRQLSRWHIHWSEIWADDSGRLKISSFAQTWANIIREMAGVLV